MPGLLGKKIGMTSGRFPGQKGKTYYQTFDGTL